VITQRRTVRSFVHSARSTAPNPSRPVTARSPSPACRR
jgi:hypothetical protein